MLNNQKLKEFLYSLFGQCTDCKLSIMTLPDKQIRHYLPEQLDQLIADGQRLGAVCNTYFDVNPKIQSLKDGLRGGSETVQYLCSLYADIDVFGPAHKEKHLPETKDAAMKHLTELPLQPTYVIDTGYGLQAYWVLKDPFRMERQDDWMKGDGILKGYGQFLTDHFTQKGWKLDPVFDLARMLRFPVSYNFKLDTPVQGEFLVFGGPQYSIEDFSEYMAPPVVVEKKPFEVDKRVVGSADRIMQRCQIARQMLDDPDSVSEPLWYALCCNSVLTPDGAEKFHEWSSNYTGYDYDETEAKIAKHLTQQDIPTPAGKKVWQRATVESILRNEKYKGSALLQKKFTVDFLQKKMKVNEGEVPQYYVEHSHEAIIQPAEWEKAQLELARRKNSTKRTYCNGPFAAKLVCGDCGEHYGSKVWHSNSKYRRTIWQCNAKYRGNCHCCTPHLYEEDLKQHFITALSELLTNREALLEDGRYVRKELLDFTAIDGECDSILQKMDVIARMIQQMVNENATQAQSQTAYIERYNTLVERYENLQTRYDDLQQQKEQRQIQADAISGCLFALGELDLLLITFTDELWNSVVDHVTVYADERLIFHFKNGSVVTV